MTAEISMEDVKRLRDMTGAGFLDCKKALADSRGDFQKAAEELRKRGAAKAVKKGARSANQGTVAAYIHFGGGRIGTLLELNCETDFVARNDDFKKLAGDIATHIATGQGPRYVRREDVPPEVIEKEKEIYREQAKQEGKPPAAIEKIVEGKLNNFFRENCLLEHEFFGDVIGKKRTIRQLVEEAVGKFGENIQIRRFARFDVGQDGE